MAFFCKYYLLVNNVAKMVLLFMTIVVFVIGLWKKESNIVDIRLPTLFLRTNCNSIMITFTQFEIIYLIIANVWFGRSLTAGLIRHLSQSSIRPSIYFSSIVKSRWKGKVSC